MDLYLIILLTSLFDSMLTGRSILYGYMSDISTISLVPGEFSPLIGSKWACISSFLLLFSSTNQSIVMI